jgi:hypothetical protein
MDDALDQPELLLGRKLEDVVLESREMGHGLALPGCGHQILRVYPA